MAPRAIGLGAAQFTFVVMNSLASIIGPGAISAFTFAFTLLQIPVGVIGVPLGVVVFPSMARELARGALAEYRSLLTRSLRLLLYVMLPIAALAAVTRRQIVTLLFGYGDFTRAAIELTANALLFFLIGLAAHALIAVLARAFYARQDTRTPVGAALVAVVVDIVLGIVLLGPIGLSGLALAIAIGAWVETGLLVFALRRHVPSIDLGGVLRVALEAGLASALSAALAVATVYFLDSVIGPEPAKLLLLAQVVLASAVFAASYVVASLALRIPELPSIVAVVADLLRRPGRS
jgi:putative peptidoglycan lipid II flippase